MFDLQPAAGRRNKVLTGVAGTPSGEQGRLFFAALKRCNIWSDLWFYVDKRPVEELHFRSSHSNYLNHTNKGSPRETARWALCLQPFHKHNQLRQCLIWNAKLYKTKTSRSHIFFRTFACFLIKMESYKSIITPAGELLQLFFFSCQHTVATTVL